MYAAADLAWEDGTAKYGEEVDETTIPTTTRTMWIDGDFLVTEPPGPREEVVANNIALGDEIV